MGLGGTRRDTTYSLESPGPARRKAIDRKPGVPNVPIGHDRIPTTSIHNDTGSAPRGCPTSKGRTHPIAQAVSGHTGCAIRRSRPCWANEAPTCPIRPQSLKELRLGPRARGTVFLVGTWLQLWVRGQTERIKNNSLPVVPDDPCGHRGPKCATVNLHMQRGSTHSCCRTTQRASGGYRRAGRGSALLGTF